MFYGNIISKLSFLLTKVMNLENKVLNDAVCIADGILLF